MRVSNEQVNKLAARKRKHPGRIKAESAPAIVTHLARDLKEAREDLEEARRIARLLANELRLSERHSLPYARSALVEFDTKICTR